MATVSVFYSTGNKRSKMLADAAIRGLRRIGDKATLRTSTQHREVDADYAVFYGLAKGLSTVFADYKAEATAVYIDLGYWRRRIRNRYDGYHKMVINSRHPTEYFQNKRHNATRFRQLHLPIRPWRKKSKHIIIAGMSYKAAVAEGLEPNAWELNAIQHLKIGTDRQIIYRPKPTCKHAVPLLGALFDKKSSLPAVFANCHAVVTRHSNVAVDALLSGIPVFCDHGVASVMAYSDLSLIEEPFYPIDRQQWANDVAWCQFTPAEISTGLPFIHFKEEGLIP